MRFVNRFKSFQNCLESRIRFKALAADKTCETCNILIRMKKEELVFQQAFSAFDNIQADEGTGFSAFYHGDPIVPGQ